MTRLDQRLREWVARTPDQLAIYGGGEQLTYAQLDRLAHRFADAFAAAGVQRGDRVGIHLPRSGRAVAAMIGALRCGAVYVPLDPSSPPQRIALIAQDCGLRHVVISPQLLASWAAAGVSCGVEHFFLGDQGEAPALGRDVCVHSWRELQQSEAAAAPEPETEIDDLAYILYTSGSTGVPKGVMLSHRNALAFVEWAAGAIALGPGDRVASVAPFHFDLSVFDVWASLSCGATIIVVDEATVLSGRRMLDRIHDQAISVWYSVPSALVLMLEHGLAERGAPSLRVVFFAGEVFPIKHLRRTMSAVPQARFFNLFGPTETNVCLAFELSEPPAAEAESIPIGRPCCGDQAFVFNAEGKEVPPGEIGELFVDGPTVMLGYWDRGRRTPARRPYPTGDMVRRRDDGALMYHGRRDHMVKVHGYRVELGEVEAALQAHTLIRDAIVLAIEQRLVAVIVPAHTSLSVLDVKRHCAERLPRYMIPSDIRIVQQLPRTSSGKIDRVRTQAALLARDAEVLAPVHASSD